MDHNEIRHKLSEYIDGAVTPVERAAIDVHLTACAACSDALTELRKTIEQVKQIEEVEAPAWMTQKIMANIRTTADERKGFFHRIFYPLAVKLPIQAVAVLFLTVTVFYIYTSTHPVDKYAEAPVGRLAKQEAPANVQDAVKRKSVDAAGKREKEIAQEPGYKSLDMKYEYEKPAPPTPAEAPAAAAAKHAMPRPRMGEASREERPASPQAAAPSMMGEQTAPSGAGRPYASSDEGKSMQRKSAPALSATSGKKDAPQVAAQANEEPDRINEVTEHFVRNDLPAAMKVKGLSFTTYKYQADRPGLQWIQETSAFQRNPCVNRFLVDVLIASQSSKYLYCYDTPRIKLIGVYDLTNGVWAEKNSPPGK